MVDVRGKEGDFVGATIVVGAVVLARKVAFEHKSECVKIGLGWYGHFSLQVEMQVLT